MSVSVKILFSEKGHFCLEILINSKTLDIS